MHRISTISKSAPAIIHTYFRNTHSLVKKNWWKRRSRLERFLFLLIGLLAMFCLMFMILFGIFLYFQLVPGVCLTPSCVISANELMSRMDVTVDPCVDFYQFACGGYLDSTIIPADKSRVGTFDILDDKLQLKLKKIIQQLSKNQTENKPFALVRKLYDSCMDTKKLEKLGLEPIKELLEKLGGWPVLNKDGNSSTWKPENYSWIDTTYLFLEHGVRDNSLFDINIMPDIKNTSRHTVSINQPRLGILENHLLGMTSNSLDIVQAYANFEINVAVLLGAEEKKAVKEMVNVVNLETKFSKLLHFAPTSFNDTYNPTTIAGLQKAYPSIPWLEFINRHFSPNHQVDLDQHVNVENPTFFQIFNTFITDVDKQTLANYLIWRVIKDSIRYLNTKARALKLKFKKATKGTRDSQSRWNECISVVTDSMPLAVSALYVRRYFQHETKQGVKDITNHIRSSFLTTLKRADWLDEKTKASAIKKLDAMGTHVGHPVELLDDSKLAVYYENLELSSDSYFQNYLNLTIFATRKHFALLWKPVNKSDWERTGDVMMVNAYYDVLANLIQIPAGILESPFYDLGRPNYLNYGSMGWVVGHEISHGFDNRGREFDSAGNLNNWWTEESRQKYENRSECMVRQYDGYKVIEVGGYLKGDQTLGENLADNGGIREAYKAYKDWVWWHGKEDRLPGLVQYDPIQLFWISGANLWCGKSRVELMIELMTVDPHPPGRFRVIGSFSNMKEFAKDFGCSREKPMNPTNKCRLW